MMEIGAEVFNHEKLLLNITIYINYTGQDYVGGV